MEPYVTPLSNFTQVSREFTGGYRALNFCIEKTGQVAAGLILLYCLRVLTANVVVNAASINPAKIHR